LTDFDIYLMSDDNTESRKGQIIGGLVNITPIY